MYELRPPTRDSLCIELNLCRRLLLFHCAVQTCTTYRNNSLLCTKASPDVTLLNVSLRHLYGTSICAKYLASSCLHHRRHIHPGALWPCSGQLTETLLSTTLGDLANSAIARVFPSNHGRRKMVTSGSSLISLLFSTPLILRPWRHSATT